MDIINLDIDTFSLVLFQALLYYIGRAGIFCVVQHGFLFLISCISPAKLHLSDAGYIVIIVLHIICFMLLINKQCTAWVNIHCISQYD